MSIQNKAVTHILKHALGSELQRTESRHCCQRYWRDGKYRFRTSPPLLMAVTASKDWSISSAVTDSSMSSRFGFGFGSWKWWVQWNRRPWLLGRDRRRCSENKRKRPKPFLPEPLAYERLTSISHNRHGRTWSFLIRAGHRKYLPASAFVSLQSCGIVDRPLTQSQKMYETINLVPSLSCASFCAKRNLAKFP